MLRLSKFGLFSIPAYYQLGIWRIQYLQKVCCVCRLYPTATMTRARSWINISKKENNQSGLTQQKGAYLKRPFFSAFICLDCHNDLDWLPPVFEPPLSKSKVLVIQSVAPHVNYLRRAIIGFKYNEQLDALPVLVHALQQLPRPQGCHAGNAVILATPTTKYRLAVRGFEPVAILAHYLSQHWQIPIWKGVNRIDETVSQQGLDRYERQENISQAFELLEEPPTRRVLLFDDVVTTGATLSALALTVLEAYPETQILAYSLSHGH